jgi:hypothetical protein
MSAKTIPFSEDEKSKEYKITTFKEMGINVNVLSEVALTKKIPSGNLYKFGVLRKNKFKWFFNGLPVANTRKEMIEVFYAVTNNYITDEESIPFVFKVKSH